MSFQKFGLVLLAGNILLCPLAEGQPWWQRLRKKPEPGPVVWTKPEKMEMERRAAFPSASLVAKNVQNQWREWAAAARQILEMYRKLEFYMLSNKLQTEQQRYEFTKRDTNLQNILGGLPGEIKNLSGMNKTLATLASRELTSMHQRNENMNIIMNTLLSSIGGVKFRQLEQNFAALVGRPMAPVVTEPVQEPEEEGRPSFEKLRRRFEELKGGPSILSPRMEGAPPAVEPVEEGGIIPAGPLWAKTQMLRTKFINESKEFAPGEEIVVNIQQAFRDIANLLFYIKPNGKRALRERVTESAAQRVEELLKEIDRGVTKVKWKGYYRGLERKFKESNK